MGANYFNLFSRSDVMIEEGKRFVQCLEAVVAYGKEINALARTLNELIVQEIEKSEFSFTESGNWREKRRPDYSNWVSTDIAYSSPIARNEEYQGYLGYQISLSGNGMSFPGNEEPLLHVCFWGEALNFRTDNYVGFPLAEDATLKLVDKRLIVWGEAGNDRSKPAWTFSLRLLTLDSSDALLERIVKPALALLNGKPVTLALSDDLPGLVFYQESDFKPAQQAVQPPAPPTATPSP
jgi:hypothetical protein